MWGCGGAYGGERVADDLEDEDEAGEEREAVRIQKEEAEKAITVFEKLLADIR